MNAYSDLVAEFYKMKNLVIVGTGDLAEIAHEYFNMQGKYNVSGFAVDRAYLKEKKFCDLPIIAIDELKDKHPPKDTEVFVAIVYGNMNRDRAAMCERIKAMGYSLATYISPHAFVSPNASIGENCFIFENNVIQTGVTIGDNCILWSGNHAGHGSKINSSCFISSHVVVSGHCTIESNCFIGVNSTMANNTTIGHDTWVSHGSIMSGNIPPHSMVKPVTGNTEVVPLNEKALARSLARLSAAVK
jgi:sugar O-acyltransferase (sialic acid O-acetyltransferase NeuD family)